MNLLADTPGHFVYSVTNNSDADITVTSLVATIGGDIVAVDGDGTTIAAGATEQYTRADASFPVGRGQIDLSVSLSLPARPTATRPAVRCSTKRT